MKNHKKNWDVKTTPKFCMCKVINDRAYDLQDQADHDRHAVVADMQLLMPAEYIINMLANVKYLDKHANIYMNPPLYQIYNVETVIKLMYKN